MNNTPQTKTFIVQTVKNIPRGKIYLYLAANIISRKIKKKSVDTTPKN